jgi:hypothetical protein
MLRRVVWYKFAEVSEVLTASIIQGDGGSKHLLNVGKLIPDCTAQHPKRQSSLNLGCPVVR